MTRVVYTLVGVLVLAVGGLGYLSYVLYEENQEQSSAIEDLEERIQPTDEVRRQVLAEVESALGESAAAYTQAANRVEDRIASLEGDVEDMQGGFTWSPLSGPTLTSLQADLDQLRSDIGQLRSDINYLTTCTQSISYVLRDMGTFVQC